MPSIPTLGKQRQHDVCEANLVHISSTNQDYTERPCPDRNKATYIQMPKGKERKRKAEVRYGGPCLQSQSTRGRSRFLQIQGQPGLCYQNLFQTAITTTTKKSPSPTGGGKVKKEKKGKVPP